MLQRGFRVYSTAQLKASTLPFRFGCLVPPAHMLIFAATHCSESQNLRLPFSVSNISPLLTAYLFASHYYCYVYSVDTATKIPVPRLDLRIFPSSPTRHIFQVYQKKEQLKKKRR